MLALSRPQDAQHRPHPDAIPSDQPCWLPGMSNFSFLPHHRTCPSRVTNELDIHPLRNNFTDQHCWLSVAMKLGFLSRSSTVAGDRRTSIFWRINLIDKPFSLAEAPTAREGSNIWSDTSHALRGNGQVFQPSCTRFSICWRCAEGQKEILTGNMRASAGRSNGNRADWLTRFHQSRAELSMIQRWVSRIQ